MNNDWLADGFRPFFLGAAWLGVAWMLLWLLLLQFGLAIDRAIPALQWHAHEMLFGYVMAVLAGFLLTAMQNWTGLRLVTRRQLALLFGVWLAGRLAFVMPGGLPLGVVSIIDLAFLPLLAGIAGHTLIAAGNRRNYSLLLLLLAFWSCNLLLHLEWHGIVAGVTAAVQDVTVLLVVTLLVFMGGRVIPFFTERRLPVAAPLQWPWLNWAATLACLALIPAYLWLGRTPALAALLVIAAVLVLLRWLAWKPWHTLAEPLLWVLHLGYAWVPAGLLLLALHSTTELVWSVGIHALMVGAMGSLTLGMMARVALGHSGRPLAAHPAVTVAFVLMSLAAVLRVLAGVYPGINTLLVGAGLLWSLALLLYALVYTPLLMEKRQAVT
ncbi:uncharacterized protein involved in response to NO [Methylohalomonas lacus]|uniref:Uncharacterized protein involved in response to NO n=1 Tax=Methylohalomonas lacus TaxID=398773 RepID=A0AAE3L0X6_9GAMM|nr:NnrS family protein [Methylohalomonas lacus]MCS3903219.1 uncharacterized protein involved in response to NO [Methylohalomonas lacus]